MENHPATQMTGEFSLSCAYIGPIDAARNAGLRSFVGKDTKAKHDNP